MAVTLYQSTDSSAPVLTGTTGSLISLLDNCLVTGYGTKPSAGWIKLYTGTNSAVFKAGGGNQNCLRVDDNASGTGGAKEARTRGYLTMSGIDAGTGPFPTDAQLAAGIILRKSSSEDATVRAWTLLADAKRFYLLSKADGTSNFAYFFGDIISFLTGDLGSGAIIGRANENQAASTATYEKFKQAGAGANATITGHYLALPVTGLGSALAFGKVIDHSRSFNINAEFTMGAQAGVAFPSPVDLGLHLSQVWVCHTGPAIRGKMPGLWAPLGYRPLVDGDTFSGTGPLSGKTFLAKDVGSQNGQIILETSNTWED